MGQKTEFLTHFEFFSSYPYELHPKVFCQMKELFKILKIYIYGKFHHWAIPQKKQTVGKRGCEDMEFSGVLMKQQAEFPEIN